VLTARVYGSRRGLTDGTGPKMIGTGIRSVVLRNGGGAASQGNNSAIVTPRGERTMAIETALLGSICDGNILVDP